MLLRPCTCESVRESLILRFPLAHHLETGIVRFRFPVVVSFSFPVPLLFSQIAYVWAYWLETGLLNRRFT